MKIRRGKKFLFIIAGIVILSYCVYSEIRRCRKDLPNEILKNPSVLQIKKKIRLKDFSEAYDLEIEMQDNTTIKFHWVDYDFFGNIKFSCIEGINEYSFSYFKYNKENLNIEYISQMYMFEKSIDHYLSSHNISTVLNNYKAIKEASNRIMELSKDEISSLYDLYKNKKDASNWINKIEKKYLLETKKNIEGCYKFSSIHPEK